MDPGCQTTDASNETFSVLEEAVDSMAHAIPKGWSVLRFKEGVSFIHNDACFDARTFGADKAVFIQTDDLQTTKSSYSVELILRNGSQSTSIKCTRNLKCLSDIQNLLSDVSSYEVVQQNLPSILKESEEVSPIPTPLSDDVCSV
jgi:hypothetical protein